MRVLLVVYDNDSFLHIFPMGLGRIAAAIRDRTDCEIEIYSQDLHHWPESHLTNYLDGNEFDIIGISVIAGYYQYGKLLALSAAINKSKNRPYFIIGGYGPTPEPEFFLRKTGADMAVMGEGDETIIEAIDAIKGKKDLKSVLGIAYRAGDEIKVNPRRPVIQDIDSLPFPAYDLFPMEYYRLDRQPQMTSSDFSMVVISARGCPFKCTFCYRMDPGYRARSPKSILDEVECLNKEFGINYISFQDDLLMSSVPHTEAVCNEFIERKKKLGLEIKWNCNGRLNFCTKELLLLMKKAGCVFINYGIESVDEAVLKIMKKGLRYEQIVQGVEDTLESGISPGLNIIFGNIGDTKETLRKSVDFLLKYSETSHLRTVRPVTPYPGSPLYYTAIEQGLLKGIEDFYENKHLNSDLLCVNFTELSDTEFYTAIEEANLRLIKHHYEMLKEQECQQIRNLYGTRDATFRGFRHSH